MKMKNLADQINELRNKYAEILGDSITKELKDLEKTIEDIQERNRRVELDKKWETSGTSIREYIIFALCI